MIKFLINLVSIAVAGAYVFSGITVASYLYDERKCMIELIHSHQTDYVLRKVKMKKETRETTERVQKSTDQERASLCMKMYQSKSRVWPKFVREYL